MKARILAKKSGKIMKEYENVLQGEIIELSSLIESLNENHSCTWLIKRRLPVLGKRPLKLTGKNTEVNTALLEPNKYSIILEVKDHNKNKIYSDKIMVNIIGNPEIEERLKKIF